MQKFRKKPVVIEAIQWDNTWETIQKIACFENASKPTDWDKEKQTLVIHTLEGDMTAFVGDWIIKGVNGEVYPCKPDIFKKTYEETEG